MWLGKFISIYGIKGYDVLLRVDMKPQADDTGKTEYKLFTAMF